ncbi:MAG: glycosyhydrolase [Bacteroidetes bacterium]|nr:MAG: glycosyhydrolase [Bacteroidota bacterium]
MKYLITASIFCLWMGSGFVFGQKMITSQSAPANFSIAEGPSAATIYTDENDYVLIEKAATLLQQDIKAVSGNKPTLVHKVPDKISDLIIIGTIGKSTLINQLVSEKKLLTDKINGKWEGYCIQVVSHPFPGTRKALVIAGNDRRGTAFGVFQVSQEMGVSPWYWWADVPIVHKNPIFVPAAYSSHDAPVVKYRGIFINDEAPAFSGWSKEKFGGFNHVLYAKVFELILRLKGNFLWPAMWGNAFYDDDSLNRQTADDYGIVIGTTHHEPLLRAHDEWRRYGKGPWNYDSNEVALKDFWRTGVKRALHSETIISIGMRGDGDKPMTEGTAISLLERIVKDQRQIITDETGKPASETPQLWALYKEVQDYYDKGMRVPDDVTLLLCDDNWGNIRKLPKLAEKRRQGGFGVYYHFDYVGDPRNYKWLNTNQIERTWEQMHLALEYGVDRIWIVNVGDIKPMEFPISFFLDYAWSPEKWKAENLPDYYLNWAARQFGEKHAKEIAYFISKYTQFNSRRKPELLSPETYSLTNFGEADRVVNEYRKLEADAEKVKSTLPSVYQDAYFELVLHPIQASSNLNALYVAAAKNHWYAERMNIRANAYADTVKRLFQRDKEISDFFNNVLANRKWHHMMDQTHIGYTYWQQPPENVMPAVKYVNPDSASLQPAKYIIDPSQPEDQPHLAELKKLGKNVFYQVENYVSIEAPHFSKAVEAGNIKWNTIAGLGRTLSGITTFPVTLASNEPVNNNPCLEYLVYFNNGGLATVKIYCSPTMYFHGSPLRFAISFDDDKPVRLKLESEKTKAIWEESVANNIVNTESSHQIKSKGLHTLKFWMVDPAVVLQKIVIGFGEVRPSYLGPPETRVK